MTSLSAARVAAASQAAARRRGRARERGAEPVAERLRRLRPPRRHRHLGADAEERPGPGQRRAPRRRGGARAHPPRYPQRGGGRGRRGRRCSRHATHFDAREGVGGAAQARRLLELHALLGRGLLVRDGDVEPAEAERVRPPQRLRQPLRGDRQREVGSVDPGRGEGRVLQLGRAPVRHRLADHGVQLGPAGDHRPSSYPGSLPRRRRGDQESPSSGRARRRRSGSWSPRRPRRRAGPRPRP